MCKRCHSGARFFFFEQRYSCSKPHRLLLSLLLLLLFLLSSLHFFCKVRFTVWLSKDEAQTTRVITVTFNLARNDGDNDDGGETGMKSYFPNAALSLSWPTSIDMRLSGSCMLTLWPCSLSSAQYVTSVWTSSDVNGQ